MQSAIEEILVGERLSNESLESLVNSFNEHPYSSTMAILLAKAYSINDDIRFESHIRKTAVLTNDRKHLHDFLFSEKATSPIETNTAEDSESATINIQESGIEITAEKKSQVDLTGDETKTPIKETKEEKDPFLNQFITEALIAGAAIDLLEENLEDEIIKEGDLKVHPEKPVDKPIDTSSKPETPSKQSFFHWMDFLSDEDNSSTISKSAKNPEQTIFPRNANEKKKVISIIDNFIQKEDSLVPKRAEFFSPSKAAKASLQDNDSVVSETLATIYAAQGNINKAISTYNKLSLLHPEKSSYFAALIEKLKSEKKR